MLVVLEGIDGVGKTTQISLLKRTCPDAIFTKEPGGTKFGEKIREILLNTGKNLSPKAEMFLFLADRAEHYAKILHPNDRNLIFSDRSFVSGIAYAMANGENLSLDELITLNKIALDENFGDKFVFIKANFELLKSRLKARNADIIEQRGLEYLKKVEIYMQIIFEKCTLNVLEIDSTLEISAINKKILEFIND